MSKALEEFLKPVKKKESLLDKIVSKGKEWGKVIAEPIVTLFKKEKDYYAEPRNLLKTLAERVMLNGISPHLAGVAIEGLRALFPATSVVQHEIKNAKEEIDKNVISEGIDIQTFLKPDKNVPSALLGVINKVLDFIPLEAAVPIGAAGKIGKIIGGVSEKTKSVKAFKNVLTDLAKETKVTQEVAKKVLPVIGEKKAIIKTLTEEKPLPPLQKEKSITDIIDSIKRGKILKPTAFAEVKKVSKEAPLPEIKKPSEIIKGIIKKTTEKEPSKASITEIMKKISPSKKEIITKPVETIPIEKKISPAELVRSLKEKVKPPFVSKQIKQEESFGEWLGHLEKNYKDARADLPEFLGTKKGKIKTYSSEELKKIDKWLEENPDVPIPRAWKNYKREWSFGNVENPVFVSQERRLQEDLAKEAEHMAELEENAPAWMKAPPKPEPAAWKTFPIQKKVIPKPVLELKTPEPPKPYEPTEYQKEILKQAEDVEAGIHPEIPKLEIEMNKGKEMTEISPHLMKIPFVKFMQNKVVTPARNWYLSNFFPKQLSQGRTVATRELQMAHGTRGRIQTAINQITDMVTDLFRGMPEKDFDEVSNMLAGLKPVEGEYTNIIKRFHTETAALTKKIINIEDNLIKKGLLTEEKRLLLPDIGMKNIGKYTHDVFERLEKAPLMGVEQGATTVGGKFKGIALNIGMFKHKMTPDEWGRKAIEITSKKLELSPEITASKLVEDVPQRIRDLPDLTDIEKIGVYTKELFGYIKDPKVLVQQTMKTLTSTVKKLDLQKILAEDPAFVSEKRLPGWRFIGSGEERLGEKGITEPIFNDPRFGILRGKYISPEAYNFINELLATKPAPTGLARLGRSALGLWKAEKVGVGPALPRNIASAGTTMLEEAGFPLYAPARKFQNFRESLKVAKDFFSKGTENIRIGRAGGFGSNYAKGEMTPQREEVLKELADIGKSTLEIKAEKMADTLDKYSEKIGNIYGRSDDFFRQYLIHMFEMPLEKGGGGLSLAEAISLANKHMLNYRQVAPALETLRTVGGPVAPFASFVTKRIPIVAEQVLTRPWVYAKYPAAVAAAVEASKRINNISDDEIVAKTPKFLEKKMSLGGMVIPFFKDREGRIYFADLSYIFPIGGWKTGFADIEAAKNIAGGPLASIKDIAENENRLTKNKIYNRWDTDLSKITKMMEHIATFVGPGATPHLISLTKGLIGQEYGDVKDPEKASIAMPLARLAGISIYRAGKNVINTKLAELNREIIKANAIYDNVETRNNPAQRKKIKEEIRKMKKEMRKLERYN